MFYDDDNDYFCMQTMWNLRNKFSFSKCDFLDYVYEMNAQFDRNFVGYVAKL